MKRLSAASRLLVSLALLGPLVSLAQTASGVPAESGRLSRITNQASQRYEINQTFSGAAYFKDNHVWVYDKDFADLFGMPVKHIEAVEGVTAVAFRIEEAPYQQCGFGGRDEACRKVEQCYLDLYFDESKTPLPWATDNPYMWVPNYSSLSWLRPLDMKEKPYGMSSPETPAGIVRNEVLRSPLIAFADPVSRQQVIVTSNIGDANAGPEDVSGGSFAVLGYARAFYRNLSIVTLQFRCTPFERKTLNLRLDAKKAVYDPPIAKFNRIYLPEGFVQRIKDATAAYNKRSAEFYRSLLPQPLGTKGAVPASSSIPQ